MEFLVNCTQFSYDTKFELKNSRRLSVGRLSVNMDEAKLRLIAEIVGGVDGTKSIADFPLETVQIFMSNITERRSLS
jgi:hypothetical protein